MNIRFQMLVFDRDSRFVFEPEQRKKIDALKDAISSCKKTKESDSAPAFIQSASSDSIPPEIIEGSVVLLCGSCAAEELRQHCFALKSAGTWPIVVLDALNLQGAPAEIMSALETDLVQMGRAEGVLALIKSERSFIYAYEKSDCTATVCLLFDDGAQALVIERLHAPHKGKSAFPGGFLRVMIETIEDCAYRELEEECGLKLQENELVLVDLRSSPARDPRAHIVDAGYAALIDDRRKQELLLQLRAGDDAGKAHLLPVCDLLAPGALAFDHGELLRRTMKHFGIALPV